jgi:hypothetical protein
MDLTEALRLQMEVQKRLHEQLEVLSKGMQTSYKTNNDLIKSGMPNILHFWTNKCENLVFFYACVHKSNCDCISVVLNKRSIHIVAFGLNMVKAKLNESITM